MIDPVDVRLRELAARFSLPPTAVTALERLLELVGADPRAPTAIRRAADVVDAHVADGLVALELERVRTARQIADLGSGAGFPGLVLAAALPETQVALIESNVRKCEFVERAISDMGLGNARVVPERAEAWQPGLGRCDVVTARALAPLNVLVEYAAPLLRAQGALVAWKGRRDEDEERDAAAAASSVGLEPVRVCRVRPWAQAQHRHLHLYVKVGSTPNRYPRRPGMASKRPLRATA